MDKPTFEQGKLHLEIYELRREPQLRQARQWFFHNYFVETLEDSARIAPPGSETGAGIMMVLTYWDQACAFLNYGLLHEDLFFETSGEFFGVWDRIKPIIGAYRETMKNPTFLSNLQQAAQRFEQWSEKRAPGHIEHIRAWTKQMHAQTAQTARA